MDVDDVKKGTALSRGFNGVGPGSSDDELPNQSISQYSPLEFFQSYPMVGVSISREQTRLASPATPAAEKAAAMREGDSYFSFSTLLDSPDAEEADSAGNSNQVTISQHFWDSPNGIGDSFRYQPHEDDKSALPQAVPPDFIKQEFHGHGRTAKDHLRDRQVSDLSIIPERRRSSGDFQLIVDSTSLREDNHLERLSTDNRGLRPYPLRRATSDGSLSYHRALSIASSLGDDRRFENVKEQINNRLKALKDSFQDSNFRLPSLPSLQMPNILGNLGKDFGKDDTTLERSEDVLDSAGDRPNMTDPGHARPTNSPTTKETGGSNSPSSPSYFSRALAQLTGDVVVLGGYRGSVLRTAEEPRTKLWPAPLRAGLNLTTVDLEVGLRDEDEDEMAKRVVSDGMLTHVGPIDISRKLLKRLRTCENAQSNKLRVHNYGYDWRLSPHRLSRELISFLENLPSNSEDNPAGQEGVTVIAHSLGGLITRHAVNLRPDLFAGVIYAATPDTCVNILGPFRKNDEILFSPRIFSYQVTFSFRTSFALLPLNGRCFVDMSTNEELPVDFFNVDDWIKYRFSPCLDPPLPTKAPSPTARTGLLNSISSAIPRSVGGIVSNFSFMKRKFSKRNSQYIQSSGSNKTASGSFGMSFNKLEAEPEGATPPADHQPETLTTSSPIPRPAALAYLTRVLAATKLFKQQLAHRPDLTASNAYPPLAVMYGKTEPTVCGAKVRGGDRAAIARADIYDSLVFGSGDGVVLARAAMLPDGYRAVRGGVVGSDRGHITLLGDLEAVGRCLLAIGRARRHGVGLGAYSN